MADRLYLVTEAGKSACRLQDQRIPVEYRRLLQVLEAEETAPPSRRAQIGRYSEADTRALMDDLVEQGLLKAEAASQEA